MSLRKSPKRTLTVVDADPASAAPSTTTITDEGRAKVIRQPNAVDNLQTMQRQFGRLPGGPEASTLKPAPGAAIRLYQELIAPYEPAPPTLLCMHFRDLARLQLELEAWEGIRDAEMEHRAQQTELEMRRRRREADRELEPIAKDILETGLCRVPDPSPRSKTNRSACWRSSRTSAGVSLQPWSRFCGGFTARAFSRTTSAAKSSASSAGLA